MARTDDIMSDAEQPGLAVIEGRQIPLWGNDPGAEEPDYLSRQLITYIGNKRALLGQIGKAVERVKHRLGKTRLRVFDAFSGSGVVARFLKAHASLLITNDLEDYAAVTARCYLRNSPDRRRLPLGPRRLKVVRNCTA